jgi:hypothetical protein
MFALGDARHEALPDDLFEEVFLALEVQVDGAFGNAGSGGDFVEFRRGDAFVGEDVECGVKELTRAFFRQAAPARVGLGS